MGDAPVTAATGALGPVVAKLSALLRRRRCGDDCEYRLRHQTRKDVKVIRSNLKSVHSILWVIWERVDVDAEGKKLRMEAWRLADDMNDAIDDFILTMKRSNDGKHFIQAKIQPSPFQDMKRRAIDVSDQCCNKWKMETAHTTFSSLFSRTKSTVDSGPAKRPRVVDPYVHKDISELMQMEDPRDKLIEHLVGEEENTPQLKMASILGPAGVGKTTLARLVYEAIQDKFQARAFVSITSCHNITEVLASILQQVAVDSTKAATKKHLNGIILNFLKEKRYLVIVDDIWHCGEWETIKKSLPDNNLGSRIVTTSRVKAITDKWRDDFDALVYKIGHTDNWYEYGSYDLTKMFYMNADMVGEGFDYGHHTVHMCAGMPLAVACLILALAKEREHQEQQGLCVVRTRGVQDRIEEQVKINGIQNTPGFEPLVESLELDYNHLPHHMLKTCLLYCSIYPEDQQFRRGDLVRRWIAEGFVCKEEEAEDYFDELVSRRLIHPTCKISKEEKQYTMHPMMRNHLRWKLRGNCFITRSCDGVPSSPIGRLCIDYWQINDDAMEQMDPSSGIDWHHIRSLVVLRDAERVPFPYECLQHLRVLALQPNDPPEKDVLGKLVSAPNSGPLENQHLKDMCGLLRLRHLLGLHGDGITEMPADIARLQYLETLEVNFTKIKRIPAEIGDLKQLKTLDVSWNEELVELPRELGNLQHILETLCIREANIGEQAWEIIGTLKKLKTLDVSHNPELSGIPRDIIGELQQLKNLDVSKNPRITELPKEIGNLQHLKALNMSGTGITEVPREIGNLQQLEALDLYGVRTITKLPQEIGKLQHLETLDLEYTKVNKIPREIWGLKKLKYVSVDIGTLPFEASQLSNLDRLPKCFRQAWKNSHLVSSLAGEILSFEQTGMTGDGGLVIGTKHMNIPRWIKEHFNNLGSLDIRICKLEDKDLKVLREMPYLWILVLRLETVPIKPIVICSGGFAKLKYLTVDSRVPRIRFLEGAMPRLEWLVFEFQFYGGVPSTDPVGINHLVDLKEVSFRCSSKWYRPDSPCINATRDIVRKEGREHSILLFEDWEYFPQYSSFLTQSSEPRNDPSNNSGAEEIEEIQA